MESKRAVSTTECKITFNPLGPVVQCIPPTLRPGRYFLSMSLNNGRDYAGVAPGKKNDEFVVFDHPKISKLIPSLSLYGGSTQMRIIGENFYPGIKTATVAFKNISTGVELERVPAAVTKPTLVTCRVPRTLNVGECHVTVALDAEEEFQSLPLKFTVYNKPRFEKVVPSIGPARGGSKLCIYRASDMINLSESSDARVKFRTVCGNRIIGEVPGIIASDGSHVECKTPANTEKNSTADFLEMVYVDVAIDGESFILCAMEYGVRFVTFARIQ